MEHETQIYVFDFGTTEETMSRIIRTVKEFNPSLEISKRFSVNGETEETLYYLKERDSSYSLTATAYSIEDFEYLCNSWISSHPGYRRTQEDYPTLRDQIDDIPF